MPLYAVISNERDYVSWPSDSNYPKKSGPAYLFLGLFDPKNIKNPFWDMTSIYTQIPAQYFIYVEEREGDIILSFPVGKAVLGLLMERETATDINAKIVGFCDFIHNQLINYDVSLFLRIEDAEPDLQKFGEIRQRAMLKTLHQKEMEKWRNKIWASN